MDDCEGLGQVGYDIVIRPVEGCSSGNYHVVIAVLRVRASELRQRCLQAAADPVAGDSIAELFGDREAEPGARTWIGTGRRFAGVAAPYACLDQARGHGCFAPAADGEIFGTNLKCSER